MTKLGMMRNLKASERAHNVDLNNVERKIALYREKQSNGAGTKAEIRVATDRLWNALNEEEELVRSLKRIREQLLLVVE